MAMSRRVLARFVAKELSDSKNTRAVVQSLAAYIVEHRLQSQLELILADIARNMATLGHINATVTTAHPLDASLRAQIISYIEKLEDSKHVTLTETVDPAVLGGVVIDTPRRRFDASVATKLKRLRNA